MPCLYRPVYFCSLEIFKKLPTTFTNRTRKSRQYLISTTVILMVSAISYSLYGLIGYRVVAYLLLVSLSFLALFLDIVPVLLSAFLSALIWDYFFIPPRYTFQVGTTEDFLLLVMYFAIALVHAVLTHKIRQIQKIADQKEKKEATLKLYNALLNSLSHELRTPIATIIGASDNLMMGNRGLSEEDKSDLLSEISIAALRLNQQVENLLSMSRLESGYIQLKKDWCDVNELIYTTVKRLEEHLKHHVLSLDIPDDMPLVKLDIGLMEQVLYNLLLNAVLYTPAASAITIKATYAGNNFILTIEDSGMGFPPGEIPRVFDKFYRLKNARTGGTGLGLSIAKGFVEAHEGKITLENAPLGGALFTIVIPTEHSYINELKNE